MSACRCPACGAKLQIVASDDERHTKRSVFHSDAPQFFESSAAPSYPQRREQTQQQNIPPGTHRDVTHLRPETPGDIGTFALKALGCGVAAMLLSICPTIVLDVLPWYTPVIVLPTVSGLSWFLVSGKAQGLVTFTENLTRLDLDRDGKVGNAPKQKRTVEVVVKAESDRRHDKRVTLPDTAEMHNLAMRILDGEQFNEKNAKMCGFSRQKWVELRDVFLDRGWAIWRDEHNHNLGIDILAAGRAALRAALPHSEDT